MPINYTVGREMTIIYLDRKGVISKRRIQVCGVQGERVRAYCFTARAPRVFLRGNILAVRAGDSCGQTGAGHAG
ncbi:WYL domain-containing protein [Paenibacillus sp. 1P07SE]|uniref:WYL domain-containing protein n=1 Tax=Paenibacillus sp. 1P07SE TaxID=3132209 RepID=UPI0039A46D78